MLKGSHHSAASKHKLSINRKGKCLRENHHNWKNGCLRKDGYKILWIDGKAIFEHRYIMEKHIGRKLLQKERVHHLNENKLDNRIENLVLLESESAHQKIHQKGKTHPGAGWNRGKHLTSSHKLAISLGQIKKSPKIKAFNEHKTIGEWFKDVRVKCSKTQYFRRLKEGWLPKLALEEPTNRYLNPSSSPRHSWSCACCSVHSGF